MPEINIQVEKRISILAASILIILILAFVIFIFSVLLKFYTDVDLSRHGGDFTALLGLSVILIGIYFKKGFAKEEYVSRIIIQNGNISLLYYVRQKLSRIKDIPVSEVDNIKLKLFVETHSVKSGKVFTGYSSTKINLKDGESVSFETSKNDTFYPYLFAMIKNRLYLPDFVYEIDTNEKLIKDEVEYFALNGKKRPFYKRITKPRAVLIAILFCILASSAGFILWIYMPVKLTSAEKEYIGKLEAGTQYRKNKAYERALQAYQEAQQIIDTDYQLYVDKAYAYKHMKDYDKMLEESDKAVSLFEQRYKSVYKKANKVIFNNANAAYLLRAEANFNLKKYAEAIVDYSRVIKKESYKYSRNEWKRGISRYYAGDISGAREDFLNAKKIILRYFADQEKEESKYKYPAYTQKDLDDIEQWIAVTQ
jgi:hypothetical protein